MEEKLKIVFFASGDFPYPTLEALLKNELYDIVGVVTSNYKSEIQEKTIKDLAIEYNIPYLVINKNHTLKDVETIEWLKEKDADIFCVISFKYLPKEILSIPKITSFNVHASLLPFLRGATPINWAIRYGFRYTGLTSFVLDEHIDTGEIINNIKLPIEETDDYGTVFTRLSVLCVGFTVETISKLREQNWRKNLLLQPDCGVNSPYMKAPKLNEENVILPVQLGEIKDTEMLYRHIQSLSPNIGTPCKLQVYKVVGRINTKEQMFPTTALYRDYDIKIYTAHLEKLTLSNRDKYQSIHRNGNIMTDGKTYMAIRNGDGYLLLIDTIQMAGKKKLSIKDFLAGFQLGREKDAYLTITGKD